MRAQTKLKLRQDGANDLAIMPRDCGCGDALCRRLEALGQDAVEADLACGGGRGDPW